MATADFLGTLLSGLGTAATGGLAGEFERRERERQRTIEDEERERQARMEALRMALLQSQVEAAQTPETPTFSFDAGPASVDLPFTPEGFEQAEAFGERFSASEAPDDPNLQRFTAGGRHFTFNPRTGEVAPVEVGGEPLVTPEEPEAPDVTRAGDLRGEFSSSPIVKNSADVAQSYQRVVQSASEPSAAGDMALIFNFMKVLDPGSVVRESEFRTAGAAGSLPARVQAAFNQVQRGERLSAEQRSDFVERARRLAAGQRQVLQSEIQRFSRFADETGVDPSNVVFDPFTGILDDSGEGGGALEGLEGNIEGEELDSLDAWWEGRR